MWSGLLAYCIQEPDLEYIAIDATIVRAHACAAGHGKQADLGNPLQFVITPGQTSDFTQANKLLEDISDSYVIGDKGL